MKNLGPILLAAFVVSCILTANSVLSIIVPVLLFGAGFVLTIKEYSNES